jgi:hypothetical protein
MLRMVKPILAATLVSLAAPAAFADEAPPARHRYPQHIYLPPERHVIEAVRPPGSGNFIINGARFTAKGPACNHWAAGERINLIAGDWNAQCVDAVFYNFYRRTTCEMWCGGGWFRW